MAARKSPSLSSFPFHVEIITRYSDLDTQGHVNNVAIADLYQEARVQFHREVFRDLRKLPQTAPKLGKVLADIRISYIRESHFPHPVVVGVGVSRLGNSSYTLYCAMYQQDVLVGTSEAALVYVSKGKSHPMPEPSRAVLENFTVEVN